jgi:hypothetical protein
MKSDYFMGKIFGVQAPGALFTVPAKPHPAALTADPLPSSQRTKAA